MSSVNIIKNTINNAAKLKKKKYDGITKNGVQPKILGDIKWVKRIQHFLLLKHFIPAKQQTK